ncbi:MAG: hypothetical protein IPL33_21075 [Sphingobacteriales bacterium]|nr:hypothetical protein [Sphingobacteriales bacterium]
MAVLRAITVTVTVETTPDNGRRCDCQRMQRQYRSTGAVDLYRALVGVSGGVFSAQAAHPLCRATSFGGNGESPRRL